LRRNPASCSKKNIQRLSCHGTQKLITHSPSNWLASLCYNYWLSRTYEILHVCVIYKISGKKHFLSWSLMAAQITNNFLCAGGVCFYQPFLPSALWSSLCYVLANIFIGFVSVSSGFLLQILTNEKFLHKFGPGPRWPENLLWAKNRKQLLFNITNY